ncbi:zinc finger domain-containing protein [Streptomyces sp. TSRI0281]|uniref:zinc finger domain-containing protein n=1 Tax=Streptomyces sp. TSRI0281 TaxID=1718998 RepID=UPI003FD0ABD0
MSDDFTRVEACDCPMSSCAAPADSPCRTSKARVAIQEHTARLRLVPQLAKALAVATPAVRRPGLRVDRPAPARRRRTRGARMPGVRPGVQRPPIAGLPTRLPR